MALFHRLLGGVRALLRKQSTERDLDDELRAYLDAAVEAKTAAGMTREDALRAARVEIGSVAAIKDYVRDVGWESVMGSVWQDIRYGVRLLVRQPGFSLVAVLTLAVGIGTSTALFSVTDATLLRPLPYDSPEQLVGITVSVPGSDGTRMNLGPSLADIRDWREDGRVFSHVGMGRMSGFMPQIVETESGAPERLTVGEVSEDLLDVYGVRPLFGRGVTADDVREGAPAVALLGHDYWRRRFGGDADVIGQIVRIAGEPATIVGVMAPGFYRETAIWWQKGSMGRSWGLPRRGSGISATGRLRPGLTIEQAQKELTGLTVSIAAARGESDDVTVQLRSSYEAAVRGYRTTLKILAYAVGFVLLIACVNVAGLLLARGAARESELAVRASIGAGRWRLVRQLLTESLLIAGAGALVGAALAWLTLDALVAILPLSLPPNSPVALNTTVLAWTLGLSVASALLFGLYPALKLSRVRLGAALAKAGRRHGPALSKRGGQVLIAVEVALAVVLLAGSGLMVRSFARVLAVDVGFDPDTVLTMEVEPVDPAPAVMRQYYPALLAALRANPDVLEAGGADSVPLTAGSTLVSFVQVGDSRENINVRQVLPGYFETLGLSARLGRLPVDADTASTERVVVINETAAARFLPDGPPIGRYLQIGNGAPSLVIGVVADIRHDGPLSKSSDAEAFGLFGQVLPSPLTMVLRPRGNATLSYDWLQATAQSVGPKVVIGQIRTASEWLGVRVATPRKRTWLLGLLGGFGLLLTMVGIFSTTAYAVARRTHEIGVRMAFGARPADVVARMVRDAAWPVAIGLAAGLASAFYATRVISAFLFETTPNDPGTLVAVTFLMAITGCLAAWVPSRRAARVDPAITLRTE